MTNKYRKPNQPCYATDSGWHCAVKHEILVSWKGLKTAIQRDLEAVKQEQPEAGIEEQTEVLSEESSEETSVDDIEQHTKTKRRPRK